MRILYIDIDSLRPDHLGCYGYHRATSPNIDRVAAAGVRFDNYYITDGPCLPSRTAMWTGRFGIHNGVINHGGAASEPFPDGAARMFRSTLGRTNWMTCLRQAGMKTATVSPFGERHSAFHWYAGFNEIYNTGKGGIERADEIAPIALEWLAKNAREENWFLHVNFWDPHTPYRTPDSFGNPFASDPLPAWLTEDVRQQHWAGCGPHSAREIPGFNDQPYGDYPLQPWTADSMQQVRRMFDGYDSGVLYADQHIGQVLSALADQNVLDETVIIISADHGENLGELNIYGDHQTADQITARVPLIVKWPGVVPPGTTSRALVSLVDVLATIADAVRRPLPADAGEDSVSFFPLLRQPAAPFERRGAVVVQSGNGSLAIREGRWKLCMAPGSGGLSAPVPGSKDERGLPAVQLFDLEADPSEKTNLQSAHPEIVRRLTALLERYRKTGRSR